MPKLHLNLLSLLAASSLLATLVVTPGCAVFGGGDAFEVTPPETEELPLLERLAPADGTIISVLETGILKSWDELTPSGRARFTDDQWHATRTAVEGHAELITYTSDGLRIGGLLVRPSSTEGRRLGAVILNRDGIAGRGLDQDLILAELSRYADAGFVAAASAYRGNQMSQGVDELGGDDVNDVLSLVSLMQRLDYVDPGRIFMVGVGRGGLMTYRALELGAPVRAAAVVSGIADLEQLEASDSEIAGGFTDSGGWDGLATIYGDWDGAERTRQLQRRAPQTNTEDRRIPLMLVHGRLNERIPVVQALDVAIRWQRSGSPVETVIYGYGNHELVEQQEDWQERVLAWIKRHDSRSLLN